MTQTPRAPRGLRTGGRKLWSSVVDLYELDQHESQLLLQACRTVDDLDRLAAVVDVEGVVVETPQGLRAHPAVVESRQMRITLARLVSSLRLPAGEPGDTQVGARPQRRSGVRPVRVIR